MSAAGHDSIEPWLREWKRVSESTAQVQRASSGWCVARRDAEAKHRGAVGGVLFYVAYQFERDGPWQENSDEGETALVEDRPRHCILVPRRGVEDHIGFASLFAAR